MSGQDSDHLLSPTACSNQARHHSNLPGHSSSTPDQQPGLPQFRLRKYGKAGRYGIQCALLQAEATSSRQLRARRRRACDCACDCARRLNLSHSAAIMSPPQQPATHSYQWMPCHTSMSYQQSKAVPSTHLLLQLRRCSSRWEGACGSVALCLNTPVHTIVEPVHTMPTCL